MAKTKRTTKKNIIKKKVSKKTNKKEIIVKIPKKYKTIKIIKKQTIRKERKIYTPKQIQAILQFKAAFPETSIRGISEQTGIPKSVIGRWIKQGSISILKNQASSVIPKIKGTIRRGKFKGQKKKEVLKKFIKKVIDSGTPAQRIRLRIRYKGEGEYEFYS